MKSNLYQVFSWVALFCVFKTETIHFRKEHLLVVQILDLFFKKGFSANFKIMTNNL